MKRWRLLYVLLVLATTLFFAACKSLNPLANHQETPVTMYNPGKTFIHPQYRVYHNSETESIVFMKMMSSELVFNQANAETKPQARLRLTYTLFSSLANNEIVKRDTQEVAVNRESVGDQFTATIKIPTVPGKTYLLDISIEDEIRRSSVRDRVLVDRFRPESQQNWLVLHYPDNKVSFEDYFYSGESFRLITRDEAKEKIYISVFAPRNSLPLPPYSIESQVDHVPLPDSSFYMAYSDQLLYKLGGQGIYVFHFQKDEIKGLCLTQFGDRYPQVTQPADMLPPLEYITTADEFKRLVDQPDKKGALDLFWLDKGKTFANARDLIRVYYNRVVFANIYFASSKEGWKTDRGMIYVLFGPPEKLERTETRETWLYEAAETGEKVIFEFDLKDDYWTGYDFSLQRKEEFRPIWNQAIDAWRRGKIFSL